MLYECHQYTNEDIGNALQDYVFPDTLTRVMYFYVADCYSVKCRPTVSNI